MQIDDRAEKYQTEFPLTGKFICVNKNVQINDSVISTSVRKSQSPKVKTIV
jgi:hypothetical protein